MMGTINCVYETPCGWCSKWDKKCDRKIQERRQRTEINPVDESLPIAELNKVCTSEDDHEWECIGVSTVATDYRCKICGVHKTYRRDNEVTTHIATL